MSRRIIVEIPEELAGLQGDLQWFVGVMVEKLYQNRHKATTQSTEPSTFLLKLQAELLEVHEQWLADPCHPNMTRELADAANFAFLAHCAIEAWKARHRQSALNLPTPAEGGRVRA